MSLLLYCARLGFEDLDSARQSKIEAKRSERRSPAPSGQSEEEDRFDEVVASPNLLNLAARSIRFWRHAFIACLFFYLRTAETLEPRQTPLPCSISIIVPCHYKHFALLPALLKLYEEGEVLPDEFVISITRSQRPLISNELFRSVQNGPWPFAVKIVEEERDLPGENRNRACSLSSGSVLVCQDADDIPHPQRLSIIKYMFETFNIDFLIHKWSPMGVPFAPYSLQDLHQKMHVNLTYPQLEKFTMIHNGNIAISRCVFSKVRWPFQWNAEDKRFNRDVLENRGLNTVLIEAELMMYRWQLSSYKERTPRKKR